MELLYLKYRLHQNIHDITDIFDYDYGNYV